MIHYILIRLNFTTHHGLGGTGCTPHIRRMPISRKFKILLGPAYASEDEGEMSEEEMSVSEDSEEEA